MRKGRTTGGTEEHRGENTGEPLMRSAGSESPAAKSVYAMGETGILAFFFAIVISATLIDLAAPASAQSPAPSSTTTGTLRGQVTDPSGAVVTNATVAVLVSGGPTHSATTNRSGNYEIGNLAPGTYTVTADAQGFAVFVQNDVEVAAGQVAQFNIALDINVEKEKVNVQEEGPQLDVNPSNNASAIVLSGKDLEALPDDPDELQQDLEALAGPSAGPNGGQLYIDGFTAGQLPPKSSIREIRINQNPFSAEYDKLGYGRIEIFTKPGTDKYHGQLFVSGNDSAFNSPNPFAGANQPGYDSTQFSVNIGGPINKKASFFVDAQRRNINDLSAVNALTLDPTTFAEVPLIEAVPNLRHRTNLNSRIDYQLTTNNTVTARYQYYRNTENNQGIGQFNLPSEGYNSDSTEHTLQISDTQIIGAKIVNETRFQYLRELNNQLALNSQPTLNVLGSFGGGGNSQGDILDHQDHYELQNYTSIIHGNHTLKFGARLRGIRDANSSTSGFNGTFTFSSLLDTAAETACLPTPDEKPCPVSYEHYAQAVANGETGVTAIATQLTYTLGTPPLVVTNFDAGLYFQDDWRVRSNLTLSYGLRFETQDGIPNHANWA